MELCAWRREGERTLLRSHALTMTTASGRDGRGASWKGHGALARAAYRARRTRRAAGWPVVHSVAVPLRTAAGKAKCEHNLVDRCFNSATASIQAHGRMIAAISEYPGFGATEFTTEVKQRL